MQWTTVSHSEELDGKNILDFELPLWQGGDFESNDSLDCWSFVSSKILEKAEMDSTPFKAGRTKKCFKVKYLRIC